MRKRAKKDNNHNDIASAFRTLGWSWHDTHQLGDGFPDGIAGRPGVNVIIEIKDGSLSPSRRKLTPDEVHFHTFWRGPLFIIGSSQEVIDLHNSIVGGQT